MKKRRPEHDVSPGHDVKLHPGRSRKVVCGVNKSQLAFIKYTQKTIVTYSVTGGLVGATKPSGLLCYRSSGHW